MCQYGRCLLYPVYGGHRPLVGHKYHAVLFSIKFATIIGRNNRKMIRIAKWLSKLKWIIVEKQLSCMIIGISTFNRVKNKYYTN